MDFMYQGNGGYGEMEAKTESYQNSKFLSVDLDKLAGKKDDLKINKGNVFINNDMEFPRKKTVQLICDTTLFGRRNA